MSDDVHFLFDLDQHHSDRKVKESIKMNAPEWCIKLTSIKNLIMSRSPSKQAIINGDTWAIGAPVCSCNMSQLMFGSSEKNTWILKILRGILRAYLCLFWLYL